MPGIDFLSALERECAAMQENLVEADLSAPVPTCTGWSIRDLVVHTGFVHRHKTAAVRDGHGDLMPDSQGDPGDDLTSWFSEGVAEMVAVFGSADLSVPTWTWCDHDHTADWWVRRMAHETLIHGVDLALAVGATPSVDKALADDGIDEILFEYMVGAPPWSRMSVGDGTIAIVSPTRSRLVQKGTWSGTDPDSGFVYKDEIGLVYTNGDTEPDASVVGSATDLDLWLWGRGDRGSMESMGDLSLLDDVRSVAQIATQ